MSGAGDIDTLIARTLALDSAATPGPWRQHGQTATHAVNGPDSTQHPDTRVVQGDADKLSWSKGCFGGGILKNADADLIAEYRTLAPQLAKELTDARAENARLSESVVRKQQRIDEQVTELSALRAREQAASRLMHRMRGAMSEDRDRAMWLRELEKEVDTFLSERREGK